MSWVAMPTFTTNEVLTAAKLQQLADGVSFLNGLSAGPIPPFLRRQVGATQENYTYSIRHRSRYMHFVSYYAGTIQLFEIWVNGVQRYTGVPASGYRDTVLDTSAYGLTLGAIIPVEIRLKNVDLLYITELDSNTSIV